MKLSLFSILMLLMVSVNSQSWNPILNNEKSNFSIDGKIISNTIWIDSVKIFNKDTIYYLNRILTQCFDCQTTLPSTVVKAYYLKNQSSFLLSQITKNNSSIEFTDKERIKKYRLNLNCIKDSLYLFDSVNLVYYELSMESEAFIWDELDSIKVFILSNLDTLIISKNHGITKFPVFHQNQHYNLVGMQNQELGILVSQSKDFLSYQIGDKLEYLITTGARFPSSNKIQNIEIEGFISENPWVYKVKIDEIVYVYDFYDVVDTIFRTRIDTISFSSSTISFLNKYPNQPIDFENCGCKFKPVELRYSSEFSCISKSFSSFQFVEYNGDTIFETNAPWFCGYYYSLSYGEGLGLLRSDSTESEFPYPTYYTKVLTAASVNGKKWGTFTDIETYSFESMDFSIFPNPVKNELTIEWSAMKDANLEYSIYDCAGIIIKQGQMQNYLMQISTEGMSNGIYVIKLVNKFQTGIKKFVVQN